jgi:poly(glycerol-phosphate) alpha-glucosyltransferase
MKTGVLVSSLSRRAGGVYDATRLLARALKANGECGVEVFGLRDADTARDAPGWAGIRVIDFSVWGPAALGYAPALGKGLAQARLDVLHSHGLWMYPSYASLRWAQTFRQPYIVSPHGMLDDWAVRNSAWKKRVAGWIYEDAHLQGAACLHALNVAELRAIRAYGLGNPVCVIPNGVEYPASGYSAPPPWRASVPKDSHVLLYLGRLHPKKGLLNLLEAWKLAGAGRGCSLPWTLVIAGWDQGGHDAELKLLARDLGITESAVFVGPQFDDAKNASYACADAFVLPSFSEGLPMVVLEAWANGLPVLMTPQCNLAEGFEVGAALRIDSTPHAIAQGLRTLFSLSHEDRRRLGSQGRRLVMAKFTWKVVAEEMTRVYRWLLGQGPMPGCVITE